MRFDSTPIGARSAYAMSLVTQSSNPSRALDYLAVSIECARNAGIFAESDRVPLLLSSVEVLRAAYIDGMDTCAELLGDDQLVIQSPWKFSEREHQTRIRIVETGRMFRVDIEVVFVGGDREVVEVGHFDTLPIAEEQGLRHEAVWHDPPELTGLELAHFESNLARLCTELGGFPELILAA